MVGHGKQDMVVDRNAAYNILRPETAEALFVLHHLTGDPIYRDWSYELFEVSREMPLMDENCSGCRFE